MTATKVRTAVAAPEPNGLTLLHLTTRAVRAHYAGDHVEADRLRTQAQALARRMLGIEEG